MRRMAACYSSGIKLTTLIYSIFIVLLHNSYDSAIPRAVLLRFRNGRHHTELQKGTATPMYRTTARVTRLAVLTPNSPLQGTLARPHVRNPSNGEQSKNSGRRILRRRGQTYGAILRLRGAGTRITCGEMVAILLELVPNSTQIVT
jgi:hypothetical protein